MIEPPSIIGKTEKLEELIAGSIQNDDAVLYVEDKDSEVVKRMIEFAVKNGRSLDIHVLDFSSNQPEHSSTINLETAD